MVVGNTVREVRPLSMLINALDNMMECAIVTAECSVCSLSECDSPVAEGLKLWSVTGQPCSHTTTPHCSTLQWLHCTTTKYSWHQTHIDLLLLNVGYIAFTSC